MTKKTANVSDKFRQFETRKTAEFKEARKAENISRDNPLPVDYHGIGVISDARADESKAGEMYGVVEVTVVNDPAYEGKTVGGAVRTFKETKNQTVADAYRNFLNDLEDMGLSRSTRESGSLEDMYNELLSSPHYVTIDVTKNSKTRDGKQVKCHACPPPKGMSGHTPQQETADQQTAPPQENQEDMSDKEQCLYLGKAHYILSKDEEKGVVDLQQVKGGKIREGVAISDIDED